MDLLEVNSKSLLQTKGSLDAFLASNINLPTLVNRLSALKFALVNVDQQWLDAYSKKLFALEEINALVFEALEDGKESPLNSYGEFVSETIEGIYSLINEGLGQEKNRVDGEQ